MVLGVVSALIDEAAGVGSVSRPAVAAQYHRLRGLDADDVVALDQGAAVVVLDRPRPRASPRAPHLMERSSANSRSSRARGVRSARRRGERRTSRLRRGAGGARASARAPWRR